MVPLKVTYKYPRESPQIQNGPSAIPGGKGIETELGLVSLYDLKIQTLERPESATNILPDLSINRSDGD
jgi:hypothetical protein